MFKTNIFISIILSIAGVYILIDCIYDQFKMKKLYRSMGKYDVLLTRNMNKRGFIPTTMLTALLVWNFNKIMKDDYLSIKVLFEYNIIFSSIFIVIIWLGVLSKTIITNRGILVISPLSLLINVLMWDEIYKYSVEGIDLVFYYKRNNRTKKTKIRIFNEEDKKKVISIIKNNVTNVYVDNTRNNKK